MTVYTISLANVSVSATQDILAAYASSSKPLHLLGVELSANGQTNVGNYPIILLALGPTVTHGTGGAAVTPWNIIQDGTVAAFTARRNDTAPATSSGIATIVAAQFNPLIGYYWQPPPGVAVGSEPVIIDNGAFSLSLDGITGTLNVSATVWLSE
jgi:hypothetical protein